MIQTTEKATRYSFAVHEAISFRGNDPSMHLRVLQLLYYQLYSQKYMCFRAVRNKEIYKTIVFPVSQQ